MLTEGCPIQTMKTLQFAAASCLLTSLIQAAPLVYNTGVGANSAPLADDATEIHYSLVGYNQSYVATSAGGYPIGPWIGDNTDSAWISPAQDTNGNLNEVYRYRTTFFLTPAQATSLSLSGQWATDDVGLSIDLNGSATGNSGANFAGWTPFSIGSGFVAGLNTLDFVLQNTGGGPTGLRVEFTNAPNVPDSGSGIALAGIALLGLAVFRRQFA